jgi:hypothetical protein
MDQPVKTPFSKDGYIIDQARVTDIRYGALTSDINGCGWIAAYNFLKRMGQTVDGKTIADELIRYTLFRGLVGTDLFRLRRYFRRHGYRIANSMGTGTKKRASRRDKRGSDLVLPQDGFHFVTFICGRRDCAQRGRGSAVPLSQRTRGQREPFDTMRGFLTQNNVIPLALIMVWPGSKAKD